MDADFDWLTLDPDEEVLWSDTPHPYSLVPAIVVGIPLAVVLVGVVILLGAYLSHRNTNYVVTSDALYKKTGVLSRNVQRIEFDKVQDTSYRQSFLGAHFGYGTVDVSTAGGGGVEMSFANVAEPQAVQSRINERLRDSRGLRDGEEPDAEQVLDQILEELRAIRSAVEDAAAGRSAAEEGSDGSEPPTAEDATGRLDVGEPGDEGTTHGRSSGRDAGELAPDPGDDAGTPDDDGSTPDSNADEFRFED